jgi:hypothetical protein
MAVGSERLRIFIRFPAIARWAMEPTGGEKFSTIGLAEESF